MIKKTFKDFILTLEAHSSKLCDKLDNNVKRGNPESWKNHKDFLHKFHLVLDEINSTSPSWTIIAKKRNGIKYDSESIWSEINSGLADVGISWKDIVENKKVILDNLDCYSTIGAYVDIILYNLDTNYNVGGWDDSVKTDFEEILVKYRYGYHQTTYGRIFLKRYWGSVDNFIENFAKNIFKLFMHETGCIDRSDMKDIIEELDEYEGLVNWKDGILKVYFEHFYEIASHGLGNVLYKSDCEKFKSFFMNWIHGTNNDLDTEDYGDYLEIDFNCDL